MIIKYINTQCNDAYSAIKVATALADVYKCGVNDLPLQFAISWFEQKVRFYAPFFRGEKSDFPFSPVIFQVQIKHCANKLASLILSCPCFLYLQAVAVFLTMLSLGLKNIKLGPQLPAFLTPNVLQILSDNYGVKQVNLADHDADLKEMIARNPR